MAQMGSGLAQSTFYPILHGDKIAADHSKYFKDKTLRSIRMGLQQTMAAIAAKSKSRLTYTDVVDTYIYYIRLDFDPVGIKFCTDEAEIRKYKVNAKAKAKLTFCQRLAMARGWHKAMFMPAHQLLCENAAPVFGFRELDQEKDTKRHMKYLRDEKLAWEALQGKAELPLGSCHGIYTAPLAMFDESGGGARYRLFYVAALSGIPCPERLYGRDRPKQPYV